ncbi:MAG: hypothetical protein AABZ44_02745, partial [Elusimicrobiota bacterium]
MKVNSPSALRFIADERDRVNASDKLPEKIVAARDFVKDVCPSSGGEEVDYDALAACQDAAIEIDSFFSMLERSRRLEFPMDAYSRFINALKGAEKVWYAREAQDGSDGPLEDAFAMMIESLDKVRPVESS